MTDYVHGYSEKEIERLSDQANTLARLLHRDAVYPPGSTILEAGCGSGAQTLFLAAQNPHSQITSMDMSPEALDKAQAAIRSAEITNVRFILGNIFHLPFPDESFDHVFVCFVLEHLARPLEALRHLHRVLKPDGSLTAIEGDHGSFYCHPESPAAAAVVNCLVQIQSHLGGNALIGRQLYPLLQQAGFDGLEVAPQMIYVDSSKPELVEGFTRKTFIAMIEGVMDQALALKLIDEPLWKQGIADLNRTTAEDGTFCYTFFKGVGIKHSKAVFRSLSAPV